MHVIGLDIGGANLKAASTENQAHSIPFPVWKEPENLAGKLAELLSGFAKPDCFAVTMTAELADCFQTKAEGVNFILDSINQMANGIPVQVWQTGAEFVSTEVARDIPRLVAASNWHALSTWVGRLVPDGNSLMIDIGSTTTDIIPLREGVPNPEGMTDPERLSSGELVYTGVRRTPLCALLNEIIVDEKKYHLAAELFATMHDVYLLLEKIKEDPGCLETANGKPATIDAACDRVTRMLCADHTELNRDQIMQLAEQFYSKQKKLVSDALTRVVRNQSFETVQAVIGSGEGEFLVDELVQFHPELRNCSYTKLSEVITGEISSAACAYAVARLGSERILP